MPSSRLPALATVDNGSGLARNFSHAQSPSPIRLQHESGAHHRRAAYRCLDYTRARLVAVRSLTAPTLPPHRFTGMSSCTLSFTGPGTIITVANTVTTTTIAISKRRVSRTFIHNSRTYIGECEYAQRVPRQRSATRKGAEEALRRTVPRGAEVAAARGANRVHAK